jgi:hypothetical protein
MHAGEKSDGCMVPVKPRTKPSSIGGGDGGGTAAGRGEGELRGRSRTQRRIRPVTEAASPRIGAAWVPNTPKADRVRPETGARCGKAAGAKACVGRARQTRADLEQQLKACRQEIAQTRERLIEAMEQQTATSEVLRIISNSPSEIAANRCGEFRELPVPGTAGKPGRYTGTYGQADLQWTITRTSRLPSSLFRRERCH